MKIWIVVLSLVLAGGLFYEVRRLYRAEQANHQKLQEEAESIDQMNRNLKENDQLLAKRIREEDQRKISQAQIIQDKKNQIVKLQQQLSDLNDRAELVQKKALAAAYLKKEKDRMASINSEIKLRVDQKNGAQSSVKTAQQNLDYQYHLQEAQVNERIKLEEQTLSQMKSQLSQIKVDKRIQSSQSDYETQKQAVDIQSKVVSNLKQQKADLVQNHTLSKDNINITNSQDNAGLDAQVSSLRQDLATEKKYYDQADKANNEVNSSSNSNSAQIKEIQTKIQFLQTEIHDLELAK